MDNYAGTTMIDTLKLANRLKATGMPAEQATALTEELSAGLKEQAVSKLDLEVALSRMKVELIVWQVGIGIAIVGIVKYVH